MTVKKYEIRGLTMAYTNIPCMGYALRGAVRNIRTSVFSSNPLVVVSVVRCVVDKNDINVCGLLPYALACYSNPLSFVSKTYYASKFLLHVNSNDYGLGVVTSPGIGVVVNGIS